MNAVRDRIAPEMLDDIRAFRARRSSARCTCGIGPDPNCAIDHVGRDEEIAIAAQRKLASAAWMAEYAYEIEELGEPRLWAFMVADDPIEFAKRVRAAFERIATEQAKAEQTRAEVSL